MKKLNLKISDSEEFKRGVEEFRRLHNLEPKYPEARKALDNPGAIKLLENKGVPFRWYKAVITTKLWTTDYSKIPGYTFLDGDKKSVSMGFLSATPPAGCLEITNIEELRKIDLHRRAIKAYPFVFSQKE